MSFIYVLTVFGSIPSIQSSPLHHHKLMETALSIPDYGVAAHSSSIQVSEVKELQHADTIPHRNLFEFCAKKVPEV